MAKAIVHLLQNIEWQYFGTLTFRQTKVSLGVRVKMWFAFQRHISRHSGIHPAFVKWVLRMEAGEMNGRLHFHFLMSGFPSTPSRKLCEIYSNVWKSCGGGISDVRQFEPGRNGAGYVAKCLAVSGGGNLYELGKFETSPDGLWLSRSIKWHEQRRIQGDAVRRENRVRDYWSNDRLNYRPQH